MTARPETVEAMRTARVEADARGPFDQCCLLDATAAVVADRLVADAVQAERRRIAADLRDLAVSLDYCAAGLVNEIANRLDSEGGA